MFKSKVMKRSKSLRGGKARRTKKRSVKKRPLNNFFKAMLAAKKANKSSFMYNGKKYLGSKHTHLGMVYRKA